MRGPIVHFCRFPGCGDWGAFGESAPGAELDAVAWFCRKHLPKGFFAAREASAPARKEEPARAPRIGGLFEPAHLPIVKKR